MRHLAPALLWLLPLLGCAAFQATRAGRPLTFKEAVGVYRVSQEKKALSVAVDDGGRRAWGAFYDATLQGFANDEAQEECERSASSAGVNAPCRLFAEGDGPARSGTEACLRRDYPEPWCALLNRYAPALAAGAP